MVIITEYLNIHYHILDTKLSHYINHSTITVVTVMNIIAVKLTDLIYYHITSIKRLSLNY